MRVARADLVPTDHNLRAVYASFGELEAACEEFMAHINTRPHRLVTQRHHHPIPRPRQPRAEQDRRTAGDLGPVAVVPLQPQARLRDPRPGAAPVLLAPAPLRLCDRPSGRALRPLIADRHELAVRGIRPDLPARAIHQLIDLLAVPVPRRAPPSLRLQAAVPVTDRDPMRDRLVIAPGKQRRSAQRSRRSYASRISITSSAVFNPASTRFGERTTVDNRQSRTKARRDPLAAHEEI